MRATALGAGEILLTSMDRDGTKVGFDVELTAAVADAVGVPVIASGGVGTLRAPRRRRHRGPRHRRARGEHLPLRRAHHRRGQGGDDRRRHHRPPRLTGQLDEARRRHAARSRCAQRGGTSRISREWARVAVVASGHGRHVLDRSARRVDRWPAGDPHHAGRRRGDADRRAAPSPRRRRRLRARHPRHRAPGRRPTAPGTRWRSTRPACRSTSRSTRARQALRDLPPDAVAALDEFDPDRDALVIGDFLTEAPSWPAGRSSPTAGRSGWRSTTRPSIDAFWDRAGVRRAPSAVVDATAVAVGAVWGDIDRGDGVVLAVDATARLDRAEPKAPVRCAPRRARRRSRRLGRPAGARDARSSRACRARSTGSSSPTTSPCSVPVELVVLRRGDEFFYAGCSSIWDPPDGAREQMRAVARLRRRAAAHRGRLPRRVHRRRRAHRGRLPAHRAQPAQRRRARARWLAALDLPAAAAARRARRRRRARLAAARAGGRPARRTSTRTAPVARGGWSAVAWRRASSSTATTRASSVRPSPAASCACRWSVRAGTFLAPARRARSGSGPTPSSVSASGTLGVAEQRWT